jgi:hypothetical protein
VTPGEATASGGATAVRETRPGRPKWERVALKLAYSCGSTPLVVGGTVFVAWLVTEDSRIEDGLMSAGTFTILGGTGLVALGLLALGCVALSMLLRPARDRAPGWGPVVAAGTLLLSNFPVAVALVVAAVLIETRSTVDVVNASGTHVEGIQVFGSGVSIDYGELAADDSESRGFWPVPEDSVGAIDLAATVAGRRHTWRIGSVSDTSGSHIHVTLEPLGSVLVAEDGAVHRVDASGELTWVKRPNWIEPFDRRARD